jgi:hypothetical protein
VLLLAFANGCASWKPVADVDPVAYIGQQQPERVLVNITEEGRSMQVKVVNPQMLNDSLKGDFLLAENGRWKAMERSGFPVESVTGPLFVLDSGVGGVLLGIVAVVAVAALIAGAVAGSNAGF